MSFPRPHYQSRHYRKHLPTWPKRATTHDWPHPWARHQALAWLDFRLRWENLNGWIGLTFAIGSLAFFSAGTLCLLNAWQIMPEPNRVSGLCNAIFFAGSIPFTLAASLQLFQAANMDRERDHHEGTTKPSIKLLGWHPKQLGWLSTATQFPGTLLFNLNTFNALDPARDWQDYDWQVWLPGLVGSILFLVSGVLAVFEYRQTGASWNPKSLAWQIVIANLIGCIAFLLSALLSLGLPNPIASAETLSFLMTTIGAAGFLIGSLLMIREGKLGETDATNDRPNR